MWRFVTSLWSQIVKRTTFVVGILVELRRLYCCRLRLSYTTQLRTIIFVLVVRKMPQYPICCNERHCRWRIPVLGREMVVAGMNEALQAIVVLSSRELCRCLVEIASMELRRLIACSCVGLSPMWHFVKLLWSQMVKRTTFVVSILVEPRSLYSYRFRLSYITQLSVITFVLAVRKMPHWYIFASYIHWQWRMHWQYIGYIGNTYNGNDAARLSFADLTTRGRPWVTSLLIPSTTVDCCFLLVIWRNSS